MVDAVQILKISQNSKVGEMGSSTAIQRESLVVLDECILFNHLANE